MRCFILYSSTNLFFSAVLLFFLCLPRVLDFHSSAVCIFFSHHKCIFRLSLCACDEKKSKSSFLPLVLHFFQRERRARRAFDNFHTRINASRRAESSRSRAHGASSVRAFLKEEERRESSFFREKRKTDEPNYCPKFDRALERGRRERERERPHASTRRRLKKRHANAKKKKTTTKKE